MLRNLLVIFVLLFSFQEIKAQDFSNKGKEFWIPYSYHQQMNTGGSGGVTMTLYITSDVNTTFLVEAFGSPSTTINSGSITAGQVVTVVVPNSYFINDDGLYNNRAVRVTGQKDIVVYSFITFSAVSAATLCLPTNVLGREYYSMNFTQRSNVTNANGYVTIIATEDNTTVEIIPSAATKGGWAANSVNNITLNKGQIYQVLGTTTGNNGVDLTGTKVRSISTGASGCQKIAVFSGSGRLVIGSSGCGSSSDNLYQQLYPTGTWGKKYITVPSFNRTSNFFRVSKLNNSTIVKVNGAVIPNASFVNGFYYEFQNSSANLIEADQPICVAQYFTSQGCDANASPYDPEMIILNPVEQNINKVTLVNANLIANQPPAHQHHIHVVLPDGGTSQSSFKYDGTNYAGTWTPVANAPGFSYTYISNVAQGFHRIESDSGFNALAYGYGGAESYGYSAGANVKDLTQNATAFNPNFLGDTTITRPIFCKNSEFNLFQRLPYKPLSIEWNFTGSGLPNPPFSNFVSNTPVTLIFDSTFINGKWVYRYKNPNPYVVATAGTYPFTVIVNNPTSDGCSGLQELDYELEIAEPPSVDFTWTHTGCVKDTVFFRENTVIPTDGRPIFKWRWLYHDNTKDSIKAPKKKYAIGGSFPVKLQVISDVGCLSDTLTKTINISDTAVCTLAVTSGATCAGAPITVTPNCVMGGGGVGTITQWIWIWGDGSPNDTLAAGTPATHTYTTPGIYTIIVKAITGTGCASINSLTITVSTASPVDFTMPANVCLPVGLANFINTSNGGTPTGTYNWNFGDASPIQTAINGTHNYSAVGPFNVTLSNVNTFGCPSATTKIFNNIRPRPTASFTNAAEVCVKDSLQFTSTSVGNGGTITNYNWTFGDATTSTLANPKKKWATSGTKTITHWITTDQGCNSDTMTKTIYVNASPVADFTFPNIGRCARIPITFTNASTFTDGVITNWRWDFGDGSPIVSAASGIDQLHPYALDGTYQVKLVVTTDKGCVSDTMIKPITITATPVASFVLPGGICLPNGFAQFTNNTTITDGTLPTVSYVWDFGDASPTSTATNPSHNYSGTGPYQIKLTATSAIGCVDDSTQTLSNIFAQPQASFTNDAEVCLNASITFTSTSIPVNGTITEHYWDNGTGTFALGTATLTTSFATTGPKTIRHYIKTSNGCLSDTATKTITVNQLPTASYTVSTTRCEKGAITFTSTAVANSGTIVEWTWNWGDGNPPQVVTNGIPLVHIFNTAGTYTVTLSVKTDKNCISTVFSQPVLVNPKPVANFDLPANVCLPIGAATFNNTTTISDATLPTVTYVWNFGDASPTTTTTNGVHNYAAVGPYNVNLQATSVNGCVHDTTKVFNNIRPRPTANFTNSAEVCVNASITFTSTSTGNGGAIMENYWDNGSGIFTLGTATLSSTYATSGNKTIRHYVKTDQGCISDTMTKTIYVNALPTTDFTFTNPQCENKNITFTSTSVANDGSLNSFVWSFGDATPNATTTTAIPQTHTYAAVGSYTVTLTVATDKGCTNTPQTKVVTISPNPVVNFGMPEICLNDPIAQFSDSSSIADGTESGFTYLWNFGDPNATVANPNTSTVKNPTHQYTVAANYNMSLEVTSNKGCKTKKDTVFTVNGATPVANFAVQNPTNLCGNKQVTIQNTSTVNFGNVTYLEVYWDWTNNPLLKTIDNDPTPGKLYNYNYPPFGTPATKTYTIRLVAYSGAITGPCVNAVTKTITVLASPNVVFTSVPDICLENAAATITQAQETTGITGVGVFSGPGIAGNLFTPSVAGVGTHTIRYTFTSANGCTDFKEQTVTVNPSPNANAGPDITILEGGSGTIQASTTSTGVTFLWTPNIALSSNTIIQPVTSAVNDTYYTLKVTSDKGCVDTDEMLVKVLKGPRVPNAFSPNGDGINDRWDIEYLNTYPGCIIEVFNIYGQIVFRSIGYGTPWDGTFKGKPLPIGTYYYVIEPKNGRKPLTGYVGIIK